jgi:hypothetical protein
MEKFADKLHITGEFDKAQKLYKETLRRLQSEQETKQETFLKTAASLVGSAAKEFVPVPGVSGIVEKGPAAVTEYILDERRYRQRLKDTERLEDPIGDLTKTFVKELNALADAQVPRSVGGTTRQRRVILFFDTFEQLAAVATPWLLDYFLVTDISLNVVLVLAGRSPIERCTSDGPKRWLSYLTNNMISRISLESFTEDETRKYLTERGITDPERIETIWQLSGGLPLYVSLLTSNPQGQVNPTADVIANFLQWIPEQEYVKRWLALNAALLSRPFNQDDLVFLIMKVGPGSPLFDHIKWALPHMKCACLLTAGEWF